MQGRNFCYICCKAQAVCICSRIPERLPNCTGVTILQHPKEKYHPLGSARIALLGLLNVQIIVVPFGEGKQRITPKIPGSRRSITGRVGSKGRKVVLIPNADPLPTEGSSTTQITAHGYHAAAEKTGKHCSCALENGQINDSVREFQGNGSVSVNSLFEEEFSHLNMQLEIETEDSTEVEEQVLKSDWKILSEGTAMDSDSGIPDWIPLPPGAALLYPSKDAYDLLPGLWEEEDPSSSHSSSRDGLGYNNVQSTKPSRPTHLIVLDGTWPKAKRVYHQNPWLRRLPHFQLPLTEPSRYGFIRKQPRIEFISTIESIVYALRVVEPQLDGLSNLLQVFDSMVEDQVRCMGDKKGAVARRLKAT